MTHIKEQNKTTEKELNETETTKLPDAEFKTLVIIEYGPKIKEEMKDTVSKIKKNIQGTKSEGMEAGIQIDDLEQKEEINWNRKEKQEFKKMRGAIGTSGTTLNIPIS